MSVVKERKKRNGGEATLSRLEAPPEMKRVSAVDLTRVSVSTSPRLLASPLPPHPNTLLRHGFRLRLRIFRHTGWLSSCWPPESRSKLRLFIVFQDLCSWSIHPPSSSRLPPWTNIFSALERETLQIVRTLVFDAISSSSLIDYFKDLCVDDMEFRTMTTDPSTSPILPLGSLRMIPENYKIECEICRYLTCQILSATGQQDLV